MILKESVVDLLICVFFFFFVDEFDPSTFAISENQGGSGTIVDSRTTLSYLAEDALNPFVDAVSIFRFQSFVRLPYLSVIEVAKYLYIVGFHLQNPFFLSSLSVFGF
ncbi:putative aspartic peptidase domain superfamily [Helianthus anomalus]